MPLCLFWFVQSLYFVTRLSGLVRGALYPAVTDTQVLGTWVPLPPLDQQRRIAARLAAQMAEVERLRRLAREQVEAARALPGAFLRQVFESEEARRWPRVRLGEVCQRPQYGYTAAAVSTAVGPKLLRITDIRGGEVNWDTVPYCECPASEATKYLLVSDDLLFARTGSTGKSFLVEGKVPDAVFASYLIRLRVGPNLRPRFAYLLFQSDQYWRQVAAGTRGGVQPNVNAELLGGVTLPLPSLEVQDRLIAQLSDQLLQAERLRQTAEAQLEAVNAIPSALLEDVFGGFEPPA